MKKKMNGEFKRGEVYWVRTDSGVGSEEGSSRPMLIVSSNKGNEASSVMNGLYLTGREKYGILNVKTFLTGRRSYILCNQIVTVEKVRVGEYIGTLSDEEMTAVERGLKIVLDLGGVEEQSKTESLEAEIEALRTEENHRARLFQKLYEKALEELAALKLEMDLQKKCQQRCEETSEKCEKPVETVGNAKVNINTATANEIVRSLGIGTYYAYKITGYRSKNGNFVDIEELRDVAGLPKDFVERYGDNLIIEDENDEIESRDDEIERPNVAKVAKVNVNTATAEEISSVSGLGIYIARRICAYRNKHGAFKKVEDLLKVDRFGSGCMKLYGDKFEV